MLRHQYATENAITLKTAAPMLGWAATVSSEAKSRFVRYGGSIKAT